MIDAAAIALLVLVFDFGVAGAALAAVIAEASGAAIGLTIALRIVAARRPDMVRVVRRRAADAHVPDQP